MKVAILGAGAMGSIVGAHIKKGGGEVYFVDVYEEHMKAVAENGLSMKLEGEPEPQIVFVDGAVTSGDRVGVCDAVIVLVKCYDTEEAVMANRALFGKETVAIGLQNGVGGADLLAKHIDADNVGVGLLKSSANLLAPGSIVGSPRFPSSPKGVYFSPIKKDTPYRAAYEELEKLLCAGGMPAECCDDVETIIWDKLATNVMYNGIAALLQISNEDSSHHEDGALLMKELVRETCEVACAKGIDMPFDTFYEKMSKGGLPPRGQAKMLHYVSMMFDSYFERKTEIDFINGAVVKEGKKYGIPTPCNETVWRLVRIMQDTYQYKYGKGQ